MSEPETPVTFSLTDDIEWLADTPAVARGPHRRVRDWEQVARKLRANPNEWALVARDITNAHASQIRSGQKVAFRPPEHYEVETHRDPAHPERPPHRVDLYMRYVGEPERKVQQW